MDTPHSPHQNHLLAALPTEVLAPFAAQFELVPMLLGDMLYKPGQEILHAYFPTTSIVSLHCVTQTGASCETTGVGNEGVVGISLFMGGNTAADSAVVQTAGPGYRLQRGVVKEQIRPGRAGAQPAAAPHPALIAQVAQTAVCNRHHSIDQQPCWLLLFTLDRIPADGLRMTRS